MNDTINAKRTKNTKEPTKMAGPSILFFVSSFVAFVAFASAVPGARVQVPQRIISLVPAVTEMLFAIGAGPQVVAVSSYDADPPEVNALPRVGALLDPDVERIISLRPDLVITYGSQADLRVQLRRASIPAFDYRHGGLADITKTMRALGARTGHADEAEKAAREIEARLGKIRQRTKGLHRPKTLLVFGRDSGSLRNIYASGGRGFLHDMLEAAGGTNVLGDIDRESVQTTTELILARAPELILEVRSTDVLTDDEAMKEAATWRTLSSVPAVRQNRVVVLTGRGLTVPGPRVAEVVERMAEAVTPGLSPRARSARLVGAFDQHETVLQRLRQLEDAAEGAQVVPVLQPAGDVHASALARRAAGRDDPQSLVAVGDAVGAASHDRRALGHGPPDGDGPVPVSRGIGEHLVDALGAAAGEHDGREHEGRQYCVFRLQHGSLLVKYRGLWHTR